MLSCPLKALMNSIYLLHDATYNSSKQQSNLKENYRYLKEHKS